MTDAHMFLRSAHIFTAASRKKVEAKILSPRRSEYFFGESDVSVFCKKKTFDALGHARLAAEEGDYAKWTLSCLSALISSIFADLFFNEGGKDIISTRVRKTLGEKNPFNHSTRKKRGWKNFSSHFPSSGIVHFQQRWWWNISLLCSLK